MPVSLVYPVYLVVEFGPADSAEALVIERISDGNRGVAVFTNAALAEAYRDGSKRGAELVKLNSHSEMANLIDDFAKRLHATHITIDPHSNNGKQSTWILLSELSA
jgi:hypothetical protein